MHAFLFIALVFAVENVVRAAEGNSTTEASPPRTTLSTNEAPKSYISDYRWQPVWQSLDEIITRSWLNDGRTIRLLSKEVVKVDLPDLAEVLVARYGESDSHRTVCLDFYAKGDRLVRENYLLLCHDTHCPPFNTQATFEKQGQRTFFNISGESLSKRRHHQYHYELNSHWQMVEGFSHFEWDVHQ